jgi:hypothetical protein
VVRARSQLGWRADVANHPDADLLRADGRRNLLRLAKHLANTANWHTYTTRPTIDGLMKATGLSERRVYEWLEWLRDRHLLAIVEGGTTPDFSPGILQARSADDTTGEPARNTASVYVLIAPSNLRLVAVPHPDDYGVEQVDTGPVDAIEAATWHLEDPAAGDPDADHQGGTAGPVLPADGPDPVDKNGTPTGHRRWLKPTARTREAPSGPGLRPDPSRLVPMRRLPPQIAPDAPPWDLGATPAGKQEHLAAAATAARHVLVLRQLSIRHVASLLREPFLAGWNVSDVVHALGHRPDGSPWPHDHDVRHVPGWFRWRLAAWRSNPDDRTSSLGPSPTQLAADKARRAQNERAAKRRARDERRAAAAAAAAPPDRQAELAAQTRAHLRACRDAAAARATGEPGAPAGDPPGDPAGGPGGGPADSPPVTGAGAGGSGPGSAGPPGAADRPAE